MLKEKKQKGKKEKEKAREREYEAVRRNICFSPPIAMLLVGDWSNASSCHGYK